LPWTATPWSWLPSPEPSLTGWVRALWSYQGWCCRGSASPGSSRSPPATPITRATFSRS
jgi:hypothetical protein